MNKLVSIILCTYNGEKYIKEQINSLLNQTYSSVEILVIDDCSTDGTVEILEKYAQENKIILHKNTSNKGVNKNFYYGFALAKGDFIAPCDQDDVWLAHKITAMTEAIKDNDLIYCNSALMTENGALTGEIMSDRVFFMKKSDCTTFAYSNCIAGHASLFKKTLLNDCYPFYEKGELYYDYWVAFTAACVGKIDYIQEPLVYFRRHNNALTHHQQSNTPKSELQRYKIQQLVDRLYGFANHPKLTVADKQLLEKLHQYNRLRLTQKFVLPLLFLHLKCINKLWYARNKGFFSNIICSIKEASGI